MRTKLLGVVCALAALGGAQLDANAATSVSASGVIFHMSDFGGGPTPAVRYSNGVALNWSGSAATMYAAAPRQPSGGALTVQVDGLSVSGTYTCTVLSKGFASRSFSVTSVGSDWTKFANFTAAEAPSGAYITVTCSVPPDGGMIGLITTG